RPLAARAVGAELPRWRRHRRGRLPRPPRRAAQLVRMSLVFAAIEPHGTLAVPDAPGAEVPGSATTQAAMEELGRRFDAVRPDATIVLTPHNVHIDGHFAVVLAGRAAGDLADWHAPSVSLECPV